MKTTSFNLEGRSNQSSSNIKLQYLDDLQSDFSLLSEIVIAQLKLTGELITKSLDEELLHEILRNEKIVDSLDITIREKVINAIILFTPRAGDLRKIMSYHDMTISMERVGDLILNIAGSFKKMDLSLIGFEAYNNHLEKMLTFAEEMLRNALYSFTGSSNVLAYRTIDMDDKVDKWDKKMEKRLAESFKDMELTQQMLINIMNINSVSYNIERIADKAVDIAEAAIYLVEGKDIRHIKDNEAT